MSAKRNRVWHKFQFNLNRDDDAEIHEFLSMHKRFKTRQYLPTIRKALSLFIALTNGDTSMLADLFPGIVESIKAQGAEEAQHIVDDRIEALTFAINNLRTFNINPTTTHTPASHNLPRLPSPSEQTTEPAIKIEASKNTDSVGAFLDSMDAFD